MTEIQNAKNTGQNAKIVLIAIVAAAVGAGGFFCVHSTNRTAPKPERRVLSVMHLESFVLNLDQNEYLRVGIDLGLDHNPASAMEKEGSDGAVPTSVIRDTILTVLMGVKADQLSTPEGKLQLKQDLLHALDQRVPELGVREIYYTEFLLQS